MKNSVELKSIVLFSSNALHIGWPGVAEVTARNLSGTPLLATHIWSDLVSSRAPASEKQEERDEKKEGQWTIPHEIPVTMNAVARRIGTGSDLYSAEFVRFAASQHGISDWTGQSLSTVRYGSACIMDIGLVRCRSRDIAAEPVGVGELKCLINSDSRRLDSRSIVRCPRCGDGTTFSADKVLCRNGGCVYSTQGFPIVGGQPALIDFAESVFQPSNYRQRNGSVLARDLSRDSWRSRFHVLVDGGNPVAAVNCDVFLALTKSQAGRPRVLVIGGGRVGLGAAKLYSDPDLELIGTDVYASDCTNVLCDAHKLPFECSSFDGVWIQAVLEHVLDPAIVVAEIHRVLRPNGVVYAETPFMQQVHEGAYDFTRFTMWPSLAVPGLRGDQIRPGDRARYGFSLVHALFVACAGRR